MLITLLFALEIRFVLKIESNIWVFERIIYYETLKGLLVGFNNL